jgi:hypothetical protein
MQIPSILLDQRRNLLSIQPFVHNINFAALATATSADGSFTTQNDSDFIIMKTTFYASLVTTAALTEATQIRPLATVLLVDSSSGRQLSDGAVQINAMFGDGKLPYIWSMPYKVNGNGTITATLANYSTGAGESYTVRLQFHGVKIFYGGMR